MPGSSCFVVLEEIVYFLYSFCSFLFDVFWNSVYLAYVSKFWWENLVYDQFFSLKENHTLFQISFVNSAFVSHQLLLSRMELVKFTKYILMGNWWKDLVYDHFFSLKENDALFQIWFCSKYDLLVLHLFRTSCCYQGWNWQNALNIF